MTNLGDRRWRDLARKKEREKVMALKGMAQRSAKQSVQTLSELLAQVFTASKIYQGKFYSEFFHIENTAICYDPKFDDDDTKDHHNDYLQYLVISTPFNSGAVKYCCGLLEIGNFRDDLILTKDPKINAVLMRVFMAGIQEYYNMVFATVIPSQKTIRTMLENCGFQSVAEYKSKTTASMITVLFNDLSVHKELPEGDLKLCDFDWDYNS